MSQFPGPYIDPYAQSVDEPRKTSGLAITALVFSIIGIVPCCGALTAPLGLLMGIIAFFLVRSSRVRKGTGLAMSAVILGLVFTAVWTTVIAWSIVKIGTPMQTGPNEALRAGFAGDIPGFKSHFFGAAASASDAEAQAFIDGLRVRYGEFRASSADQAKMQSNPPNFQQMMQPVQEHSYRFEFANKTVDATVETATVDPQTQKFFWGMKFGVITIHDPDLGDMTYPSGASPAGATSTRPTSVPSSSKGGSGSNSRNK